MEFNGVVKGMLIVLIALYVISPLDLAPGPLDDVLLLLLSVAANRRKSGVHALPPDETEETWQN